jgi:hypothetical protein
VVEIQTAALEEANGGYVLHWTETNTLAMYFKSGNEYAKMRDQEKKGRKSCQEAWEGDDCNDGNQGQMLVVTVVSAVALAVTLFSMEMTAMDMAVGDLISKLMLAVYFLGSWMRCQELSLTIWNLPTYSRPAHSTHPKLVQLTCALMVKTSSALEWLKASI